MNFIWIVKENREYGYVYLSTYAGFSKQEVYAKVLEKAWEQDSFRGSAEERLSQLGWEVVKVRLIEIPE
jgi:hypothetical protein